MRIGVLTSSRADYGIYLPLLKIIKEDPDLELSIICFGSHLSPFHGYTVDNIVQDGFEITYKIESMIAGDSPNAISTAIALTLLKFAEFWKGHQNEFDLVFCLGDRYEMFAAVMSGVPYGIKFAHVHGGEKTLGAIDNIFRHSITLASTLHFVSCEEHSLRVEALVEYSENIFNVGALSLDNLKTVQTYTIEEFASLYKCDLSKPTILVTLHPETVSYENNAEFAEVVCSTINDYINDFQFLITLPNSDTVGNLIRKSFLSLQSSFDKKVKCYENLGLKGYFTAMKYCSLLLGNTSSGIIEAASFNKRVINLGNRQKGRVHGENVLDVPFVKDDIKKAIQLIMNNPLFNGANVFYKGQAAENIITIVKNI